MPIRIKWVGLANIMTVYNIIPGAYERREAPTLGGKECTEV